MLFFGSIGALTIVRCLGTSWFCCFVAKRVNHELPTDGGLLDENPLGTPPFGPIKGYYGGRALYQESAAHHPHHTGIVGDSDSDTDSNSDSDSGGEGEGIVSSHEAKGEAQARYAVASAPPAPLAAMHRRWNTSSPDMLALSQPLPYSAHPTLPGMIDSPAWSKPGIAPSGSSTTPISTPTPWENRVRLREAF